MQQPLSEEPFRPQVNKLNVGTRLVDHFVMTFVAMFFGLPVLILDMTQPYNNDWILGKDKIHNTLFLIALIGFALYFCKDSFNGRSVAKRLFKLQVVNKKTGEAASPLRCLFRNLFCVLWMIEVMVTMVNPKKRIGDRVAGTEVVYWDGKVNKPNWLQVIIALLIAYLLMVFFVFWLDGLMA